ncbi:SbcC/MukB-like Walker B domain-containing protein, partial [Vibrio diabolicus]
KTRDVATLSGGESFMAALALALGLSDVVQSYSGGIRLDTLFIDEGFGSLDPESLDLAIQTLVDLQQTGRMIGVISHVSELKEQMAQRIDVEPSRVGSIVSVKSQCSFAV